MGVYIKGMEMPKDEKPREARGGRMYEMKQCPFCGETGPVKIVIRKGEP